MSEFSRAIVPMGDLTSLAANPTTANANYFTTALNVPSECFRITITVALSASATLKYQRNSNTLVSFNGGTALAAGASYSWTIGCRPGDTFQMQDNTGVTVQELQIEGFHGGF